MICDSTTYLRRHPCPIERGVGHGHKTLLPRHCSKSHRYDVHPVVWALQMTRNQKVQRLDNVSPPVVKVLEESSMRLDKTWEHWLRFRRQCCWRQWKVCPCERQDDFCRTPKADGEDDWWKDLTMPTLRRYPWADCFS